MVNTKKLFKRALEGVISRTLVAAVLLTQLNLGARAADGPTKFIPVADLNTSATKYGLFKSDSVTDKVAQKVYFGKNGSNAQGWWIAGYDSTTGGLVLVCDPLQVMKTSQKFLDSSKYEQNDGTNTTSDYYNKTAYTSDWGCTYSSNEPTGRVFANHYGGSDIKVKLKELETNESVFSTAEQGMMKETTVWTWDKKNDKFYSTTGKLYLGAGDYNDYKYFTVGANTATSDKTGNAAVNNGLTVGLKGETGPEGSPYITGGRWFWLRSPYESISYTTLAAGTSNFVSYHSVNYSYRCFPACALDLESVIFASAAAPAASSSALSDGVYFRMRDNENKINATATATNDTITVTKGSEGGEVYLMVQGNDGTNDWVYSKKLERTETISADTIHAELTSLENCKVWVETTVDNVTYAKMEQAEVIT